MVMGRFARAERMVHRRIGDFAFAPAVGLAVGWFAPAALGLRAWIESTIVRLIVEAPTWASVQRGCDPVNGWRPSPALASRVRTS
jgi:hypothetical protein